MNKKENKRTPKDIEYLINGLLKLNIFCKPLIPNLLHWKGVIEKIIPFLKLEFFPSGTPIIHYGKQHSSRIDNNLFIDHPITKLYIVCRGQAKEFTAKSTYQMLKQSQINLEKATTVTNIANSDYYSAYSAKGNSPTKKLGKPVTFSSKDEAKSPVRVRDKETSFDGHERSIRKMPSLVSVQKGVSEQKPRNKHLKEARNAKDIQEIPEVVYIEY